MNKNRLILNIGLIIVVISFIISIGFSMYVKLDSPLFLENYNEIYLYGTEDGRYLDRDFVLNYITNSSDKRVVTDIYIPNMPNIDFRVSEYDSFSGWSFMNNSSFPGKIIGRYSFRTIYGKIYLLEEEMDDDIEIKNLIINFDNGDTMNADIGKIIIKNDSENSEYIVRNGAGASSSGNANSDYLVMKDVILEKLDSPFLGKIGDSIEIRINNIDYKDINGTEFKIGDTFNITSKFDPLDDVRLRYTNIQLDMDLYFKDYEGTPYKTKSHYIVREPRYHDLNFKDLISYLKLRGAI